MTTTTAQGASFAPGVRIRARDEEWIVRSSEPVGGGHFALRCIGVTELVRGYETIFLSELEKPKAVRVEETDLVVDDTPAYRRSRLFIESLLRRSPPTDAKLYVGHHAALRPSNYQLRPAQDALKALRPRILIADGVGLGKTLEVGVLLSELILRGRGEKILVVVMKSMLAQFQRELWTRFTIPLVRLDSEGIKRVRTRIPTGKNPFHTFKRAIISVDTLKNERQYRSWLEECHWDAVVIDECHNAINIGTGRQKVASLLARTSEALILASATPHNGRPESFANLMQMLEPTAITNPTKYTKEDIKGLYRRRFKKDVASEVLESFPERDPKLVWADANHDEEAVFEAIEKATFRTLDRKSKLPGKRPRDVLFKTVLLKSFLSSPWALIKTCDERIKNIEARLDKAEQRTRELEADRDTLVEIRDLTIRIAAVTKVEKLFGDVLPELGIHGSKTKDPRVVIFSERIATLMALESEFSRRMKLQSDPEHPGNGAVAVLTGAEPDTRIQEILESFSSRDGAVRVLLASDMASEGINLHHFCSRLVHFDVPWSLIRLEQRTGRVDRFGQKERPRIRYLLNRSETSAKSDIHVVETLIEKELAAKTNLGDEGALMGLYDPDAEEEAIAVGISADETFDAAVAAAREDAGASDDGLGPSFLDEMLGTSVDPQEPPPEKAARPTMFRSDLEFFVEALHQIEPQLKEEAEGRFQLDLRPHPERPELTMRVPADLKRRFEALPHDARPADDKLFLSADPGAIMAGIEASRDRGGEWPAVQLLWRMHPALEWAADRVLVGFGRHEAPIVVAPGIVAAGVDCIALFEGTLSNQNGQPIVVDWFGLPTTLGPSPTIGVPLTMEAVLERAGLAGRLANPGPSSTSLDKLTALRPKWAEAAAARMQTLRSQRGGALRERLLEGTRRAVHWESSTLEQLDGRRDQIRQKVSGRRLLRQMQLVDFEAAEVKKQRVSRQTWLTRTLSTDERPYLRLVAVFVAT